MAEELKIRLFATLSEVVGQRAVTLPVPGPLSVAEVLCLLTDAYPALASFLVEGLGHESPTLLAVNGRAAGPDDVVSVGDDLLLAPQVSGG